MGAGFRRIACTQPRRIACHALSKRVAFESANVYGTKIAYQVRFDKTVAADTRILFLTEVRHGRPRPRELLRTTRWRTDRNAWICVRGPAAVAVVLWESRTGPPAPLCH